MVTITVGERIHIYRKRLGESLESLAEKCGIEVSVLKSYENDEVKPDTEDLNSIADALTVPAMGGAEIFL